MTFIKRYEPLLLFFLFVPVLILRVNIESTNYCTPDSDYYLEVSRNILSGEGFVGPKVFDFDSTHSRLIPLYYDTPFGHPERYQKEFFAVWPLGYPLGIVATSWITGLESLWASKLFNILLLALDFYLLYLLFDKNSFFPMYYFGSYTMLEICSYTWSENLFLPFFLLFILSFKHIHQSNTFSFLPIVLLSIALIGMSLARYASVIFYVAGAAIMVRYYFKKERIKSGSVLLGLTLASLGLGIYLLNNYWQSGYMTGMPRANTQDFSSQELIRRFFLGIFNQIHIIKQCRISSMLDIVFYSTTVVLQLSLMIYLALLFKTDSQKTRFSAGNKLMILLGILYLVFLAYMTFTSTIDPFDYRTLLPFSFPVFIAFLNEIEKKLKMNNHSKAILMVKLFFLLSLLLNLPKQYLINLII